MRQKNRLQASAWIGHLVIIAVSNVLWEVLLSDTTVSFIYFLDNHAFVWVSWPLHPMKSLYTDILNFKKCPTYP